MTDIDIVNELRDWARSADETRASLMRDAADKIERLQGALEEATFALHWEERLRGEAEWEYALQADGEDEPWSAYYASRELLTANIGALADRDDERLVRRRAPGPWEPVKGEGDA